MPEGRVIKAYSGHYFVKHEDGIVHCSLRGKFRKEDKNVLVGDIVSFKITDSKGLYGVIEDILPRKTYLTRPPVANVDQVVVVIACQEPPPNIELLDRILVAVEADCLDIVICFNKIDLVSRYAVDKLAKPYRNANYEIIKTSARAGWGITKLRKALSGNLSVFGYPLLFKTERLYSAASWEYI
jgi:ribosome biogenesis GTPase